MTMAEAEKKMEIYREVFSVVRLFDKSLINKMEHERVTGEYLPDCRCYSYWEKDQPCDKCVVLEAFQGHKESTKIEFIDARMHQVIARYVEIDGNPYVMELIREIDEEILIDSAVQDKLVRKLSKYREKIYQDKLYKDALTGAYNRRYYEDEIKNQKMNAGIAMIDVDDFKIYNDTSGHQAGDQALVTVARVIRGCIRKSDILIRYGGDEFLLVLPEIQEAGLERKLHQILNKIYKASVPGYSGVQLSVSIGGVLALDTEVTENAIGRADKLMYRAKTHKNMVVTQADVKHQSDNGEWLAEDEKMKQQILIVDDSEINREILSEMLGRDYRILEAANGQECVTMLEQYGTGISLILLDIVMPVMDGFEVLGYINRNNWLDDIPVIMISSEGSDAYIRRAYELGVSDYISRPFDAKVVFQRVFNTIKLYAKQRRLISLVTDQIYEKEKNNHMMIGILSHIVEFRNGESGTHVLHINKLTEMLLNRLMQKTDRYEIGSSDQFLITTASALHDIGKIGIDDAVLNKPGRLTDEEFEIMKTHTLIGARMLDELEIYKEEPLVKVAYQICRWHHERYDGRGYPDGLKGEEIPISAQVVSVADVYDALVSERVYKKAFSHEKAIDMIVNGECGQFNPLLIECLLDIQDDIKKWMERGR